MWVFSDPTTLLNSHNIDCGGLGVIGCIDFAWNSFLSVLVPTNKMSVTPVYFFKNLDTYHPKTLRRPMWVCLDPSILYSMSYLDCGPIQAVP